MAAWGKLNKGARFIMLTVDVLRAISVVNWGRYEWPIIGYLIEHSWGTATRSGKRGQYADPVACNIPIRPLARATGLPFQKIAEAKNSLIVGRVIVAKGDGYTFNKSADEWLDAKGKAPRLSAEMVAYCHSFGADAVHQPVNTPRSPQGVRSFTPGGTAVHQPVNSTNIEERTRDSEEREKREQSAQPPKHFDPIQTPEDRRAAREITERWDMDAMQAETMARSWRVPMRYMLPAIIRGVAKKNRIVWSYIEPIAKECMAENLTEIGSDGKTPVKSEPRGPIGLDENQRAFAEKMRAAVLAKQAKAVANG